jgi:hypothetical protein
MVTNTTTAAAATITMSSVLLELPDEWVGGAADLVVVGVVVGDGFVVGVGVDVEVVVLVVPELALESTHLVRNAIVEAIATAWYAVAWRWPGMTWSSWGTPAAMSFWSIAWAWARGMISLDEFAK